MRKNKRLKFVIITAVLLIAVLAASVFLFSKKRLYERLCFELPENIEITEMKTQNNIKTLLGLDDEVLAIKFTIPDEELDDLFQRMEESDGHYIKKEDLSMIPHPEATVENWDFDYSKLEYHYCGYTTRRGMRGLIVVFVTKAENGERWVYIKYTG